MSEGEVDQTILRAIQGRGEARKDLLTINRRLSEISRLMGDIARALSSLPGDPARFSEEALVRKLLELPDGKQIGSMLTERGELIRRIQEAGEYLKSLGFDG